MSYYLNTEIATALKEKPALTNSFTYSMDNKHGITLKNQIIGNIQTKTPDVSCLFKYNEPIRPITPTNLNSC
jgi:hypothetical protein